MGSMRERMVCLHGAEASDGMGKHWATRQELLAVLWVPAQLPGCHPDGIAHPTIFDAPVGGGQRNWHRQLWNNFQGESCSVDLRPSL